MMKSAEEYNSKTSATELYAFLAQNVVEDNICSFSGLKETIAGLPRDARLGAVLPRVFKLLRKLHWGFFRDVDPEVYPKVWNQVVIADQDYPACGDLKRNLTISDVYVGIIDLHGYTRFCEKNKNNLSMLQLLDDMIQLDVAALAKAQNVVLQRRQGDEMVLVGASACDVLAVTLQVLDYFAKRTAYQVNADPTHRSPYKIVLDEMHISAGIAGGKKFTPFIITRDGDLSGGVVNTAARLQARANQLSASRSCILITRTVCTAYASELKLKVPDFFKNAPLRFFDSGWIDFKGISVAVHEVLYAEEDREKLKYEAQMQELYKAIDDNQWKEGIFVALVALLMRVFRVMPRFRIQGVEHGKPLPLHNEDLAQLASVALTRFRTDQDYGEALETLSRIVQYAQDVPGFDRLCLEYAQAVLDAYTCFCRDFAKVLHLKLEEKVTVSLTPPHQKLYHEGRKGKAVFERLQEHLRKSLSPLDVSLLWSAVVDERQSCMDISIYSGKK